MGKGSNTTTQQASGVTSASPDANAYQAYLKLMGQAGGVASTPYQGYTGQEVAPVNDQQSAGIGTINQATGDVAAAGAPLSASAIQQYMNPYTNDVVNATQADFDTQNARAQSQVTGNAAAQGALGGDRVGVAQALTAEGQARAQAPVIAGLRSSAYNSGLSAAQQQQQYGLTSAEALSKQGQQQMAAGQVQQTTQQAQDTQARADYYQQQGYPFQVAQWLAGIDTGVGSQMGGTSTNNTQGQTTGPAPNTFAQIAGMGLAGFAMSDRRLKENVQKVGKLNDGQTIYRFNYKGDKTTQIGLMHDEVEDHHPEATGRQGGFGTVDYHKATEDAVRKARGGGVAGFASGGLPTPFANDAQSWVPQTGLTAGHGAPSPPQVHAPEAPKDQSMDPEKMMKGVGGLGKAFSNSSYGDATSDYAQDLADGDAGSFSEYLPGGSWRGGRVRGYASGGTPGGGLPWLDDADAGWYAPDLIPTVAGFGASTPAVQSRAEEPADIPGQFRLDEQAHRDWQGRVDRDTGRARTNAAIQQGEPPPELQPAPKGEVMLAQNDNGVTDPGLAPRGPRPLSAQEDMANAIHDNTVPAGEDSALGYAPEPRRGLGAPRPSPAQPAPDQQPQGSGGILGGLGIHLTPELRQGLLMAGLSMMSTRRGGPGSFLGALGEGGISGVASYEKTLENARQEEAQQRKEDFERMKFERPFEQQTQSEIETARHNKAQEAKEFKPTYGVVRHVIDPNTGLDTPIMGWINPNTTTTTEAPGQMEEPSKPLPPMNPYAPNAPASPGTPDANAKPNGQPQPGQGVLDANAQLVGKGTYNYREDAPYIEKGMDVPDPEPTAGHSTASIRSQAERFLQTGQLPPVRAGKSPVAVIQNQYRNAVENYGNALAQSRGMSPEEMATAWREAPGMLRFVLGADGRATVALGTAVRHLDTLKEYADLWNKKAFDTPAFRRVQAEVQRQFGSDVASNMDTVAHIVGPEILKAIGIAGAGSKEEREKISGQFSSSHSAAQLAGAIGATQRLMSGQLEGKERQASLAGVSHDRFRKMIGDRPYEILSTLEKGGGGQSPAGGGGSGFTPPAGAVSRKDASGKTWYYDPSNKQPYPGQ